MIIVSFEEVWSPVFLEAALCPVEPEGNVRSQEMEVGREETGSVGSKMVVTHGSRRKDWPVVL